MSETADPLGTGLVYEDRLPLRWQPAGGDFPGGVLSHVDEANAEFLSIMAALEARVPELTDEHSELAHEMRRLESKIDLLLGMASRLLAHQRPFPETVPVRLRASGIEWLSPQAPAPGERVLIELYLRRDYPLPLMLAGKAIQATEVEGGRRTTVIFEDLSDAVRDWLEKIVFRQHRRRVAHARRGAADKAE
jgi:hypothetical protein